MAIAACALFLHANAGAEDEPALHTVRPGDTLWEVATEHYPPTEDPRVKIEGIRAESDLDGGYTIQPGEVLELPD